MKELRDVAILETIHIVGHRIHKGDILLDKYRVERLLGQGGMAVVIAARHLQLDQMVAIKTMSPRALSFPDAVERFIREAKATVRLHSENVARVTDIGTLDSGVPYMIMEYLEGVDLATVLQHRRVLAAEDAVDFVLQACAAMYEAHSEGIIHRDLKPSNLFLTQRVDGSALIKVLDFGISKVAFPEQGDGSEQGESLTGEFSTIGSPPYMSPEQARSSKNVDGQTDIWSLGILLYQLSTAHLPFFADSAAEILAKVMYEQPEMANTVAPWVPRGVALVIDKCLQKDPVDRYQGVEELAHALAPYASLEGKRHFKQAFGRILGGRRSVRMGTFTDDRDTEVDGSMIVEKPQRLRVTELLAQLPKNRNDQPIIPTMQAANGELATGARSSGAPSRKVVLAAVLLILLGLTATAIVIFSGRSNENRLRPSTSPQSHTNAPEVQQPDIDQASPSLGSGGTDVNRSLEAKDAGVTKSSVAPSTHTTTGGRNDESSSRALDKAEKARSKKKPRKRKRRSKKRRRK